MFGADKDSAEVVLESCVVNIARDTKKSYKIPVTLWVYRKKVQAEALVDSGATTMFINQNYIERNHLVTHKLEKPIPENNADRTPNRAGHIKEYVQAYLEIDSHRSTNQLFITQLGDKDMMLGFLFLYKHNPELDWQEKMEFIRCPDTCASKARKTNEVEAGTEELQLEPDLPWELSLDKIGIADPENPYINWIYLKNPNDQIQQEVIAFTFDKEFKEDNDEDTANWKSLVPEWVYEYGNMFSKKQSERMPERKTYDHPIDFEKDAVLPKPAKIYPLSPKEQNSLDKWIDEELRKGYI